MIYIKFEEPDSQEWRKWRAKCEIAQIELNNSYANGKPLRIRKELYSEFKQHYFKVFHGKCAYCESYVIGAQYGDLDHFRPKGRVCENSKTVNIKSASGKTIPHPGYYWLAYDYKNLLPSCIICNRIRINEAGQRIGKWHEFPVKKNTRAEKPNDEVNEEPLLLNPITCEDLNNHFIFSKSGVITRLTDKAKTTCSIFGLNRDELVTKRGEKYRQARYLALTYLLSNTGKLPAAIISIRNGTSDFSAVGKWGLKAGAKASRKKMKKKMNDLI
jgi:hypothetical protein